MRSHERKAANGHVKAKSRKHRVLWDEVPSSNNDSSDQDMSGELAMRELLTDQSLCNTQIATMRSEHDAASMPNSGIGADNVWHEKHYIRL